VVIVVIAESTASNSGARVAGSTFLLNNVCPQTYNGIPAFLIAVNKGRLGLSTPNFCL
jgi:hypothetical protein